MGRIIFLVDMNAFFIMCETIRNPDLRGKPAAVAGDPRTRTGIVFAANYEARHFGVKTTMTVHEARRLCPGLIFVPPDHRFYEEKSGEVMELLARYSPVIQQNSIDEAWLDMTGSEALFGRPGDAARRILEDIRQKLGLWCSIGISENKFLAKMASEMKKPLGITQVWEKDVPEKLWPLPVRQMYGIGRQTEKKLTGLTLFTIGDIAACDVRVLHRAFGRYGDELHRLAHGIDPSPVTPLPQYESKSMGRSTTLPADITDLEEAKDVLLRLSEQVGADVRRCGYTGRTVSIVIKYADFSSITRQKSIQPTCLSREVYRQGVQLLEENWNPRRPVRLLGITLGNMDEQGPAQVSILSGVPSGSEQKPPDIREEKLERAMDSIREKYGAEKVQRAKLLRRKEKETPPRRPS